MEATNGEIGKIMVKKIEKNIITALDVGTSKITVLIAEGDWAGASCLAWFKAWRGCGY
jgi:hypothetical protein